MVVGAGIAAVLVADGAGFAGTAEVVEDGVMEAAAECAAVGLAASERVELLEADAGSCAEAEGAGVRD